MGDNKKDLRSMDEEDLLKLVKNIGETGFRAKQIFEWIHRKAASSIEEMSNLSLSTREKLTEKCYISDPIIENVQKSKDGTRKFLLRLEDGEKIECVLLEHDGDKSKKRKTLCVSTQAGCPLGCVFCATGQTGFRRDLTVGEILGQVYAINSFLEEDKVGNVVFMGMGEPFLNYNNSLKAIRILIDPAGLNIGQRRITVSTAGIVPGIEKLAEENLDIVLAISLHAPNDRLRSKLMPLNNKYNLKQLKQACENYVQKTGRRISFEYAIIEDFNDTKEVAEELIEYLKGLKAHLNIIPINSSLNVELKKPKMYKIIKFTERLKSAGLNISIRAEKGQDILAACGQLRRECPE